MILSATCADTNSLKGIIGAGYLQIIFTAPLEILSSVMLAMARMSSSVGWKNGKKQRKVFGGSVKMDHDDNLNGLLYGWSEPKCIGRS